MNEGTNPRHKHAVGMYLAARELALRFCIVMGPSLFRATLVRRSRTALTCVNARDLQDDAIKEIPQRLNQNVPGSTGGFGR